MFGLAHRVNIEQGGTAGIQPVDEAFDQMCIIRDAALQDEGGPVGRTDQADFLSDFLFPFPGLSIRRHIRDLADEAGRAGLATRIGVDLGIEDEDLDRVSRHQRA